MMSTGMPYRTRGTIAGMPISRSKQKKDVFLSYRSSEESLPKLALGPDATTVGGRLVICREQKGITKAAAARIIKISQQAMGELERGESKQPAAGTLLDMRDKLGYDPDYIIRGRGVPLIPNFEEAAKEQMLLTIFRELRPDIRDEAIKSVQALRRAQG